jgi:uncharacterized protein YqeY
MGIKEQVVDDMKQAMIAKDQPRLDALRLIRAEMLKAEKETGQPPDDERQMAVLQRMLKQRQESIEQFDKAGRTEMADQERREADVIRGYMPESLSEDEIRAAIEEVVGAVGADPKQMGKIMGQVMGKLKGTGKPFDAKGVNQLVKERLGG